MCRVDRDPIRGGNHHAAQGGQQGQDEDRNLYLAVHQKAIQQFTPLEWTSCTAQQFADGFSEQVGASRPRVYLLSDQLTSAAAWLQPGTLVAVGAVQMSEVLLKSDGFGPCQAVLAYKQDGLGALYHRNAAVRNCMQQVAEVRGVALWTLLIGRKPELWEANLNALCHQTYTELYATRCCPAGTVFLAELTTTGSYGVVFDVPRGRVLVFMQQQVDRGFSYG
jgi:hypothetical protein